MKLRIPGRVERELKKLLDISFSSYANPREIQFRLGMIMSDPRFYSEANAELTVSLNISGYL
ncbi:MAG: hypothetical protein RQ855_08105 [Desulfurococcales archaeon]|jgi:hypothetical protein|nr:hypothetical protein [Desulfurococcales archaeon]